MGNSLSKKLVFNFGLGVATTAALGYIWFGPKPPTPSRVIWEPTIGLRPKNILGLYNFGNSCYLNSLLQALASSRHYIIYINKYYELKNCSEKGDNNPSFRVVSALSTANRYINREAWGDDAEMAREIPKGVLAIFKTGSHVPLATHLEQDTHEAFNIIQSAMLEEQKALQGRPDYLEGVRNVEGKFSLSICDHASSESQFDDTSQVEGIVDTPTETPIVSRGPLTDPRCLPSPTDPRCPPSPTDLVDWNNPFVGRVASILKCIQCLVTMPIKFEEFNDLTLTLTQQQRDMLTLRDLIDHYFVSTIVHGVNCPTCSATAGEPAKSSFHKKTFVSKLPRSLCLHVNRAMWDQRSSNKRFDFIPFEVELDMSSIGVANLSKSEQEPLMVTETESETGTGDTSNGIVNHHHNTKYELTAVICHRGSVHSGHFVTYRRVPAPSKQNSSTHWFMVSDTSVKAVTVEEVQVQHAYMLFYDRIESEDQISSQGTSTNQAHEQPI